VAQQIEQGKEQDKEPVFHLKLGKSDLVISRRYEMASIINDFLIALWFTLGSIFILYDQLELPGIWLFIIGSAQLLIRPGVRLAHRIHLEKRKCSSWEY
jgi:hypothetical protein